jgi:hypothetical protein
MTTPFRNWIRSDREGQTLAVVAVSMVALLAIMSLGIDLGMAYTARAEAQRVADSAALAGASVFWEAEPTAAAADARAREFAARNVVRNRPVDPVNDVMVWVLFDEGKVRVRIERTGLPAWFARFIGWNELTVSAVAAASVMDTGAAECLKPWAVIDLFHVDGKRPVHEWDEPLEFDRNNSLHTYAPNNSRTHENVNLTETGYGAEPGNFNSATGGGGDFGRKMVIKAQDPNDPNVAKPGVFLPIRLPDDPNQVNCFSGGGGAAAYRNDICGCNSNPIEIDQEIPIEPGNMVGPTRQGIRGLLDQEKRNLVWREPNTVTDPDGNYLPPGVVDASDRSGPLVTNSSQIVNMVLIGPDQITKSGMQNVTVTNLAMFFIEGIEGSGNNERVIGRFFGPMKGTNPKGKTTSPEVKILRLVE